MELAYIDVPDEFTGAVISKLQQRKGELRNMGSIAGGYTRLEFHIPARGLIGYRGEFMTDTKGNGILNTMFDGYEPYKGEIAYRATGSLIAFESGEAVTYGLFSSTGERNTLYRTGCQGLLRNGYRTVFKGRRTSSSTYVRRSILQIHVLHQQMRHSHLYHLKY